MFKLNTNETIKATELQATLNLLLGYRKHEKNKERNYKDELHMKFDKELQNF